MTSPRRYRPLSLLALLFASAAPCAAQLQFDPPVFLATGGEPVGAVAADIDLDGDLDILVPCRDGPALFVHESDGKGGFAAPASYPLPDPPHGNQGAPPRSVAAVGDLDGDCLPDVVVPGFSTSGLLFSDGTGGFTPAMLPYPLHSAVLIDFDADLDLDIIFRDGDFDILPLLNDGAGNFTPGTPVVVGLPNFLIEFSAGDFNEDGNADLCYGIWSCSANLAIRLGNGTGGFGGPTLLTSCCDPSRPLVMDVTGDGHLDIVVGGGSVCFDGDVFRGTGTGAFQPILFLPGTGSYGGGDLDRDGSPDLINSRAGVQDIYFNDGNGGFLPPVTMTNISRRPVDLDGDGAGDFLSASGASGVPGMVRITANRSIAWQREPVGGKWYVRTLRADWAGAELDAAFLGGHLVTVDSAAENQWLASTFGEDLFIGYTDAAVEGVWEWVAGDPFGYENWAPGEPDDAGDSDFCRTDASGLWHDEPATTELRGIVELVSDDCDQNGFPDAFEIAVGWTEDVNGDGIPDHCVSPYFCPANLNSSGGPAEIALSGTPAVGIDTVQLDVTGMPLNQFGYFLMSDSQGYIPMVGGGQGDLCLGLPFIRFAGDVLNSGMGGSVSYTPDLLNVPGATVTQGSTWQFQCWFRDQNPGQTSNLSTAVHLTFSQSAIPFASIDPPCTGLEEQATQFDVAVELSWAHHEDVVVAFTLSGTATDQVDWRVETVNPLVIPAGQRSGVLTITVAEDAVPEATETGRIELTPSSTTRLGFNSVYELRIRDDD